MYDDRHSDVGDIHAVLEVFIYDENADKKAVFLGKVAIPLLRVCFDTIIDIALRESLHRVRIARNAERCTS